jgi:hypothetical protein
MYEKITEIKRKKENEKKQIKNPFFLIFLCIDYNELLYKYCTLGAMGVQNCQIKKN